MGAGIEALAQKLSNATQCSEGEIRTMASSLSNATFPLDEVLGLMELGAQQGLESAEALKEYANFWDTVGDATGLSSEALAKAGAALAAVGVEVGNESELLGAFGLIARESTGTVQAFLDGIGKMAPELSAMGVSVDEAAVIMTAMEREMGKAGRTAQTEFKEALEQSETGLAGVLEQLGLSEAQYASYSAKLGESTGVMAENAEALASTKTVMDKMKSSLADLAFANGAMIEKASALAPLFLAAGPIMAGFGGIMGILTPAVSAAKLAFLGLNLSMGPITLIIIGIGGAITAGIVSKVFSAITDIYNSKLGWLLPAGPLIKAILFLQDNWDEIWGGIQTTFKTVTDALVSTFRTVKGTILGIWDGMVTGIKGGVRSIIDAINTVIKGYNAFKIQYQGLTVKGKEIIPGFTIDFPDVRTIPTLAKGGIVNRPTLAMLGESGPEAVVPLGRGRGAGMTINLVINGDINGMDDFEQKVTSVIRDAVLGGGFSGVLARA